MRRLVQSIIAGPIVILLPAYVMIIGRAFGFLEEKHFESLFVIGAGYALCCLPASIFLPVADLRGKPLNWLVGGGLVIGLVVVAYFFWNSGRITLRDTFDLLLLWCFVGPAVVAVWNLVLIVRTGMPRNEKMA